jgi:redox-sensitive bicupin YhaK (pirin superfamily)
MITLRRSDERHHDRRHRQEVWRTFYPEDRADGLANGFGTLQILNEDRVPPGADLPTHPHHDAEILTYVREGALAHEDSRGRSGVIQAGEFQCRTARASIRHSETNASGFDWAHVFQIQLRPSEPGLEAGDHQKRFPIAERRGVWCIIASPDGRKGSLCIHQGAMLYSAVLDPGQHVIHELSHGHGAWLHIVKGEVLLGDVVLTTGDGVGFTAERAVSLTAREQTELLLLDLGA